jgi:hypothetical protein
LQTGNSLFRGKEETGGDYMQNKNFVTSWEIILTRPSREYKAKTAKRERENNLRGFLGLLRKNGLPEGC